MHRIKHLALGLLAVFAAVALTAAPAFASGKPFVETKPATSIGETTATLNGIVNPNGATTKYHFEYGATVAYGKNTAEVSVGAGTSNLEEAKAITELTANTSYHFRIVATNSNGTTNGSDAMFSTLEKPGLPEFVLGGGETLPVKVEAPVANRSISFSDPELTFVTCAKGGVQGEITGRKKLAMTDELTECVSANGFEKCNSVGAPTGVIRMSGSGTVVYIEKATKKVGVVLALATVTIHCGIEGTGIELKVHGNLLTSITPINTKTKTYEMPYKGTLGKQELTKYENEKGESATATPELNFDGVGYTPGAFTLSLLSVTTSKAVTISA